MNRRDEIILKHLLPLEFGYYSDTYFCFIYKHNKNAYMYTVSDKVKAWVEKNGGQFRILSNKQIRGEHKGFIVQIIFPCYGKRDMKNVMATLY